MPACTYLSDAEVEQWKQTGDNDIDEVLSFIREQTGETWLVEKRQCLIKHWFRKAEHRFLYSLYHHLGSLEYEIINFAPHTPNGWSINMSVNRQVVLAYLYGFAGGIEYNLNQQEKKSND